MSDYKGCRIRQLPDYRESTVFTIIHMHTAEELSQGEGRLSIQEIVIKLVFSRQTEQEVGLREGLTELVGGLSIV